MGAGLALRLIALNSEWRIGNRTHPSPCRRFSLRCGRPCYPSDRASNVTNKRVEFSCRPGRKRCSLTARLAFPVRPADLAHELEGCSPAVQPTTETGGTASTSLLSFIQLIAHCATVRGP